jgi:tripeptidyl-peptidase I
MLSHKYHPTAVLPLRFALSQPNIHAIEHFINDISHPDSPNYGKHWTPAQVAEKFAPSHDTIQTVKDWLLQSFSSERIRVAKTKGWIEVDATVEEAEKLLNADYHVYKHASGKEHVGEYLYANSFFPSVTIRDVSVQLVPPSCPRYVSC